MKPVKIQLSTASPISSVSFVDRPKKAQAVEPVSVQCEADNQTLLSAAEALRKSAEEIQAFGRDLFASHREQLVRLSLEIAAKVLGKDIQERNYEMEKILMQALEDSPGGPVTVRLNPEDLKTCRKLLEENHLPGPDKVQFQPDQSLGPAECAVETSRGVIEWRIEEHLKQISSALLEAAEKK